MTSMPASRNARAMTFAPRSWPSSPGLAITTRIFRIWSVRRLNERDFLVFPPDLPEGVAHLADRRIRAHAVEERIHRVVAAARRLLQRIERAAHRLVVSGFAQFVETSEL